jgi:Fe-S cluster assembly protein SufB
MYNLNTKKAIVDEDGTIEWVTGSFGSKISMLYPASILKGDRSKCEYTGVSFAGLGQNIDTGAQVVHIGKETTSNINSKSISKNGGVSTYRGLVKISKEADNARSTVSCESLILDNESKADTIPAMDIQNDNVDIGHEAKTGRISEEAIFYLMSRGLSEQEAKAMIVRGFVEPISKELPLEYAVEMNNLIKLELESSVG